MQPETPQPPQPDFDFMLKNNQPARRLPVPQLSRPVKIIGGTIVAIILIIVVVSALSGNKGSQFQPMLGVLARGAEIQRVTTLVTTGDQDQLQDGDTQSLAATIAAAFASEQAQMTSYLAKNGVKVGAATLAADTDKSTDASLQTASQNGDLDAVYVSYIKSSLARYQTDLQNAYKTAGPNGKKILNDDFNNVQVLLNSPPLK